MIRVSAPGKVHLMGEHAVVYGHPAFLAAINRRLTVSVASGDHGVSWSASVPKEAQVYGDHILGLIARDQKMEALPALAITVQSEIPFGYHLGSSAAFAVALIGAVVYFLKQTWNPVAINKLAFVAEQFVHGTPSGGDNTIVTFGGWLWFRTELPFLKSIWQVPLKLPDHLDHFYLINTGKPSETTGEMVAMVSERLKVKSEKVKMVQAFHENEEHTRRMASAIKEGDEAGVVGAMRTGEKTLEEMGVVSDQAAAVIRDITQSGGAAKILGGGGRRGAVGFLLAYHASYEVLAEIAKKYAYPVEPIILGEEGIRLEEK